MGNKNSKGSLPSAYAEAPDGMVPVATAHSGLFEKKKKNVWKKKLNFLSIAPTSFRRFSSDDPFRSRKRTPLLLGFTLTTSTLKEQGSSTATSAFC
jgi:hypothetical protein